MQTVTIPKTEYQKILKNQRLLQWQVLDLRKQISKKNKGRKDQWEAREFLPSAIRRIKKAEQEIKKGGGIRFKSTPDMMAYLDNV